MLKGWSGPSCPWSGDGRHPAPMTGIASAKSEPRNRHRSLQPPAGSSSNRMAIRNRHSINSKVAWPCRSATFSSSPKTCPTVRPRLHRSRSAPIWRRIWQGLLRMALPSTSKHRPAAFRSGRHGYRSVGASNGRRPGLEEENGYI